MPNTTRRAEWDGAAPRPFTIEIPDSKLNDLRERLSRTRWPDQMEGAAWEYGIRVLARSLRLACARGGVEGFRQFTARVGGVDLHFIHEPLIPNAG